MKELKIKNFNVSIDAGESLLVFPFIRTSFPVKGQVVETCQPLYGGIFREIGDGIACHGAIYRELLDNLEYQEDPEAQYKLQALDFGPDGVGLTLGKNTLKGKRLPGGRRLAYFQRLDFNQECQVPFAVEVRDAANDCKAAWIFELTPAGLKVQDFFAPLGKEYLVVAEGETEVKAQQEPVVTTAVAVAG